MTLPSRPVLAAVFGAFVLSSGVYRKLSGPAGWPAFWFGVVTGCGVLLGAWLLGRGQRLVGGLLVGLGLVFVVGWFGYECLFKQPWAEVEWRPLSELVLGVAVTILMLVPRRQERGA